MIALYIYTGLIIFTSALIVLGGAFLLGAQLSPDVKKTVNKGVYNKWSSTWITFAVGTAMLLFLYLEFGAVWPWWLHFAGWAWGNAYNFARSGRTTKPNWPLGFLGMLYAWITVIGYWSLV